MSVEGVIISIHDLDTESGHS